MRETTCEIFLEVIKLKINRAQKKTAYSFSSPFNY